MQISKYPNKKGKIVCSGICWGGALSEASLIEKRALPVLKTTDGSNENFQVLVNFEYNSKDIYARAYSLWLTLFSKK